MMPKSSCSDLAGAYAKKRESMHRKKLWRGGYAKGDKPAPGVAPDYQDDDLRVTQHYNTTGEPHTAGKIDVIHPMEYMSEGGIMGLLGGGGSEPHDFKEDVDEDYMPDDDKEKEPKDMLESSSSFEDAVKRRQRRFSSY